MDKLNINDKNNIEDNNKSNEKDDLDKIVDGFHQGYGVEELDKKHGLHIYVDPVLQCDVI